MLFWRTALAWHACLDICCFLLLGSRPCAVLMLAKASSCSLELSCPHLRVGSVHCIEITLHRFRLFPPVSSCCLSTPCCGKVADSFNASKCVGCVNVREEPLFCYIMSIHCHKYGCWCLCSAPIDNASTVADQHLACVFVL